MRSTCLYKAVSAIVFVAALLASASSHAQISSNVDVDLSQKTGDDNECAISKNPSNKLQLFALCNNAGPGLFAARSTDGGATWTYPDPADKTIADGDANQGAAACCDPTLAWDTFGNLYITYIDAGGSNIVTLLSTDGGLTFSTLATFGPASVDQPTVVAANTSAPGAPVAVWIVWNQGNQMVARGAAVTGLNAVGAFQALQTIPGTVGCSFGDVAIAPSGAVVQVCETPTGGQGPANLLVNTDADGLGPGNFAAAVTATSTNVGGFDFITPQNGRSVDAEAGLAYDRNPTSPHVGRLYLVYTEETVDESNDTDIMVRFSDNNGGTWSAPSRVNDDPPGRSQFLPKIASNRLSGNIAVCWHDCRNSATNTAMQEFCSIATPSGAAPAFFANGLVSDGASVSNGAGVEFGDYSGLDYFQGLVHPIWADTSNAGGLNPSGTSNFDAYTDRVSGLPAANEGDPHITTVDGIHYDFQSAGEFVVLRDADGMQIQTRQTPVPTASVVTNAYTGLTTCVSLNTAVAARVGNHRVTYEPNLSGVPDPSGLQLRVDGNLTTLGPSGINLGASGRIIKAPVGDGIEIDFANGTILVVTANWWPSQSRWYLNVDLRSTPALEGIMGALARNSWLPLLPDGTQLGPKPTSLHQRFVDLYDKFANAWRVTKATSLFDYAPGTSTDTFTLASWPTENGDCTLPQQPPIKPADPELARTLCQRVTDKNRNANCIFDVRVTAEPGFAKAYEVTQQLAASATTTVVSAGKDPTRPGEAVTFTAMVTATGGAAPAGAVQFLLDDKPVGAPVALDAKGLATWTVSDLGNGVHQVAASFAPAPNSGTLASTSLDEPHVVALLPGGRPPSVRGCRCMIGGGSDPDVALAALVLICTLRPRRRRARPSPSSTNPVLT